MADIPAAQLVAPLHVIDISSSAEGDRDATLSVGDVVAHEVAHGEIAAGSAVFLFTGWDRYRHDADAYMGSADEMRFPGFGVDSARLLVDRGVVGLGIDTLSVDSGGSNDFVIHREVTLPRGVWHVENLVNLAAVPPVGATVVVGVPKIVGRLGISRSGVGSGSAKLSSVDAAPVRARSVEAATAGSDTYADCHCGCGDERTNQHWIVRLPAEE